MKVVYLVRNPGIRERTPDGWGSAVIAATANGTYADADLGQVEDADALVVGLEPVDEALLERAPRLRLVQRIGRGYSNIDLEAAERRGVPVCGMPDFNAGTVAEHTLMLILGLLRQVFDSTLLMKAGRWPLAEVVSRGVYDLAGKTVGIVGFGAIGRAVAVRARPFEVRLCCFERRPPPAAELAALGVEPLPLDVLLRESDIVTLHLPLTPETEGMLGRAELATMKPTALLVNTARGALVDEAALAEALRDGGLAGAGIDVFSQEPWEGPHLLRSCPNVLLTPHSAGQTREAMERMVGMMLVNLGRLERGEELLYRLEPVGAEK